VVAVALLAAVYIPPGAGPSNQEPSYCKLTLGIASPPSLYTKCFRNKLIRSSSKGGAMWMGNIDVKLYAKTVELQAEAMPISKFWSYSNIIVYYVQDLL